MPGNIEGSEYTPATWAYLSGQAGSEVSSPSSGVVRGSLICGKKAHPATAHVLLQHNII